MTINPIDLELSARELMPGQNELHQRMQYLEMGPQDIDLLRHIHPLLQPHLPRIIDAFYQHLLSVPVLRQMLGDGATLARLRRVQSVYFHALTAGDYGNDYVRNRLRVGLVHQRIGLAPIWYVGAYRKYLSDLAPILHELLRDRPHAFLPTYAAVSKVISFDMSLALDTYIQAGSEQLIRLRNYSEQIISSMPSGVMVIDDAGAVRTVNQSMLGMLGVTGTAGGHAVGAPYAELVADAVLRELA
jgi:PAS domain-containing protein